MSPRYEVSVVFRDCYGKKFPALDARFKSYPNNEIPVGTADKIQSARKMAFNLFIDHEEYCNSAVVIIINDTKMKNDHCLVFNETSCRIVEYDEKKGESHYVNANGEISFRTRGNRGPIPRLGVHYH